jgi:hypothetical protein
MMKRELNLPALEADDVLKRDLQQVQQNVQDLENNFRFVVRLAHKRRGKIWALYNAIAIHRSIHAHKKCSTKSSGRLSPKINHHSIPRPTTHHHYRPNNLQHSDNGQSDKKTCCYQAAESGAAIQRLQCLLYPGTSETYPGL